MSMFLSETFSLSTKTGMMTMISLRHAQQVLPGVALCGAVALAASAAEHAEIAFFGVRWIESLVLAIVFGMFLCTIRPIDRRLRPGIDFSAKMLLELAVVLLGGSISLSTIG